MSLLRLDIGSSGQQSLGGFARIRSRTGRRAGGSWTSGATGRRRRRRRNPLKRELTIELTSGSLVNVLA